ncbi:HNH endonuclease [Staphylococcus pseudintermedius]|uniref:HNH endonuclease n=1 Tax=Staphylococcus pseudintermedius TaxID=283734 RepID=UPI0001F6C13F|nr:HNH endonuclease [Staphylococcus pseudintermedius]AZB66786.1 homing endonuclease [Staphylococcus phage phiSP119-2]ADV05800.1 Phage-associated homing endonuclease [Staphylococcus pseudintermedius HKU10-03]EGQ0288900.1 HNH endonuclease [Staphylococcus pseudintermedius]EGQ0297343.1 HNH endonuclease [Staphylococcus pseudintermedius]EGQ0326599.1 HNH endonuclease [Staphylococcus pseudintermedius]
MSLTKQQRRTFYNSMAWREKRADIMRRDHFECQRCKSKGKVAIDEYELNKNHRKKIKLVVHHIKELADYPELCLDDDNLETLCVECHNEIHDRNFKSNFKNKIEKWDDEKW